MRGLFYSGIMILVVFTLFSILIVQNENVNKERQEFSIEQEVRGADLSYRSIERSLHTLSDVSLRRAMIVSQDSVVGQNQSFFGSGQKAPDILKQLMWNGTLPNQSAVAFMQGNTLEENILPLEEYYSQEPRNYDVSISIDYSNSTIGIYDAFTVFFNTTAEVNISKIGVANFSRKMNILETVSLIGFEDTLYLSNVTFGKVSRIINRSRFMNNFTQRILNGSGSGNCYGQLTSDISTDSKDKKIFFNSTIYMTEADSFCGVIYVSGTSPNTSYLQVGSVSALNSLDGQSLLLLGNGDLWSINDGIFNVSNFISHVHEGGYTNSSFAPSFFDMLEGNLDCSYCAQYGQVGLETIIDKNILSAPELHIDVRTGKSNALHEYLQNFSGHELGMNESSVDATFYDFRLADSMRYYFQ